MKLTTRKLIVGMGTLLLGLTSVSSNAAPFGFWATDGWTSFAVTPVNEDGQIGPGGGGQLFDAEYLYFKQSLNTLSIGLQAGFDIVDGHVFYNTSTVDNYYTGDLGLSFDGNTSTYEYAVDWGLLTRDYSNAKVDIGSGTGIDPAGFYAVSGWNNNVYSGHTISNPFAMTDGTLVSSLSSNLAGSGVVGGQTSYWRTVTFDISSLGLTGPTAMNAHWTMSCGNDFINGSASFTPPPPVPEPSSFVLMMLSLMGLGWAGKKRLAA